jgi:6-phosphogluconolactonase
LNSNIKIHCLKDLKEISKFVFEIFSDLHCTTTNRFYVIPGGSTPIGLLNLMSNKINDWSNTKFILSDERLINDNKISNEYMAEKELLKEIRTNEKPTLIKYNRMGNQEGIEKIINNKIPVLTILGFGADGHTASLFPGNMKLYEHSNICLKVKNSWEDYYRISLSFEYLMKSNQIIFLVSGESKAEALNKCFFSTYDPLQYPAQYIFHNYNKSIDIFCDKAAGKYIA